MSITFQIISLVLMQIHIHNVCDGVNCCVYCYAIYIEHSEMNFFFVFKKCNCKYLSLCRFFFVLFLLNLKHMCMLNVHFIPHKSEYAAKNICALLYVHMSNIEISVMMNKLKRFEPSQLALQKSNI